MARAYAGILGAALFLGMTGWGGAGYDPIRQTISELLVGPGALPVQATFVLYGVVLIVAVAPSLARRLSGQAGASVGVSMCVILGAGCAALPLLPPEPWPPASMSASGISHLVAAAVLFIGMPVMCIGVARAMWNGQRWPRLTWASAVVGVLCALVFVGGVYDLIAHPSGFAATHLGLVERAEVYLFVTWQGVLSLRLAVASP